MATDGGGDAAGKLKPAEGRGGQGRLLPVSVPPPQRPSCGHGAGPEGLRAAQCWDCSRGGDAKVGNAGSQCPGARGPGRRWAVGRESHQESWVLT